MPQEYTLKEYIWNQFELTGGITEYMFYREMVNIYEAENFSSKDSGAPKLIK